MPTVYLQDMWLRLQNLRSCLTIEYNAGSACLRTLPAFLLCRKYRLRYFRNHDKNTLRSEAALVRECRMRIEIADFVMRVFVLFTGDAAASGSIADRGSLVSKPAPRYGSTSGTPR